VASWRGVATAAGFILRRRTMLMSCACLVLCSSVVIWTKLRRRVSRSGEGAGGVTRAIGHLTVAGGQSFAGIGMRPGRWPSLHGGSSLFGWLVADGWCWFVLREEHCWLVAGGWFVLKEKYCWLVADKPSEQGVGRARVARRAGTRRPWLVGSVIAAGLHHRVETHTEYSTVTRPQARQGSQANWWQRGDQRHTTRRVPLDLVTVLDVRAWLMV
jgi:hypothetical protein